MEVECARRESNNNNNNSWQDISVRCKLVPPDGGWGFAITLSVIVVFCVTVIPMTGFEIVYGPFLKNVGDVTSDAAIVNNMFNTILYFTGLITNQLLQKFSYRKVGLLGSILYCIGSFSTIFVTSMLQFVVTFSVLQGLGFGLMLPCMFTAFNIYFDKNKKITMNAAQNALGFVPCFVPAMLQFLMDTYGFRGTVAILAAISLNTIPAMMCLHPVKWHLKEQYTISEESTECGQEDIQIENDALLEYDAISEDLEYDNRHASPRKSLVSMGSLAMPVANLDKLEQHEEPRSTSILWYVTFILAVQYRIFLRNIFMKMLGLGLLKDVIYINITIGLALSMASDVTFLSVYPLILINAGLNSNELGLIMTIYFASDLVARSILSILTPVLTIKNRYQFLAGITLTALFRTAFVMYHSFWWITINITILGFMRCLLQSPFPLVIAEAFPQHFVPAFSIYMIVCGCVSLIFGPLTAIVKATTQSDIMVVHFLTVALLVCAISWSIELFYVRLTKKQNSQVK